jgi:hypothetical protein
MTVRRGLSLLLILRVNQSDLPELLGADKNQTLKAIAEAEAYPVQSLIIAYAPVSTTG